MKMLFATIAVSASILAIPVSVCGQEKDGRTAEPMSAMRNDGVGTDSLRGRGSRFGEFQPNGFEREGSLAEEARRRPDIETWQTEAEFIDNMFRNPSVSMTSTVELVRQDLPKRIIVLPNNTLRLWRVNVSNGSAGNWGSFPNSYLDARTLSFPAPR